MTQYVSPRALDMLSNESNTAADAAMAEAIPHIDGPAKEKMFRLLLSRKHTPSLARIVGQFHDADESIKHFILEHVHELTEAVRGAIDLDKFTDRTSAIELIVQSNKGCLVGFLVDALQSRCPRTSKLAAAALNIITAQLLQQLKHSSNDSETANLIDLENHLAEALKRSIRIWDKHKQPQAMEAAMWLSHRLHGAFQTKLRDPRSNISATLNNILKESVDPAIAGFVLCALSMPTIRAAAAKSIGEAQDFSFIQAIVRHGDLLKNNEIKQGLQWIRQCRWLDHSLDDLLKLDKKDAVRAVRLLTAMGSSAQKKSAILRELMQLDDYAWPMAVLEHLQRDNSGEASEILTLMAVRCSNQVAESAANELRRRYGAMDSSSNSVSTNERYKDRSKQNKRDPFDRYFNDYNRLSVEQRMSLIHEMKRNTDGALSTLRAKLATGQPIDRARALQLTRQLDVARELSEQIYRLTHDLDPLIRSLAVAMLSKLPSTTTRRILKTAIADADARVRANAVEVMDQVRDPNRKQYIEPMLKSDDHRARANAVVSLLKLGQRKAGDTLIHMLEDSSRSHRLSGLWVIDRLNIEAMSPRVEHMMLNDADSRIRLRAKRIREQFSGVYEAATYADEHTESDIMLYTTENSW